MKVRFHYVINGPNSDEFDAIDYLDAPSEQELRIDLSEAIIDNVHFDAVPDPEDVAALWAEIQRLKDTANE